MNIKEMKELLNLMREHGLAEIELEKEGLKIKLKKNSYAQFSPESASIPMMMPAPQAQREPLKSAAAEKGSQAAPADNASFIRSPMVGTYYSAPAPDQPAYVTKGQSIKAGDVLCIIEAMKLMNEIKSDVSGIIEEILVKNGDALEFDQPLFRIRKA